MVRRSLPRRRQGLFQEGQVNSFIEKHARIGRRRLRSCQLERLPIKDKAFVIAESFKESKAKRYAHDYVDKVIIPIVTRHPVKFASGLGKENTGFFFYGLSEDVEPLFKRLGKNLEKFVRRIHYKNKLAAGALPFQLARGISKNLDPFLRGMGKEGLLRFDRALKQSENRPYFLRGLEENHQRYLDAVKQLK